MIYIIGGTPIATPGSTNALRTVNTRTIIVSNAAADYTAEITYFKVSGITAGALYLANGSTALTNGEFFTSANALAGLIFNLASGTNGPGTFSVKASTSATEAGVGTQAVTVTVAPWANTPSISGTAYTRRGIISTNVPLGYLVITNNANDAWGDVRSYFVTNATGGSVYKPDGTITDSFFVTAANANTGLRFKPSAAGVNPCTFDVYACTNAFDGPEVGKSTNYARGYIYIQGGTPTAIPSTTNAARDVLTENIVISNAVGDVWSEISYYKVSSITGGKVYRSNGTDEVTNDSFVTNTLALAGLKFKLTLGGTNAGSFAVAAATNSGGTVSTGVVTVSIGVRANAPVVNPASSTIETNAWATNIAVRVNATDNASEATHFKVATVFNGILSNSIPSVSAIVTADQIVAFSAVLTNGLNFRPTNGLQTGYFVLQGATNSAGAGLSVQVATGTVGVYTYAPIIAPSVAYTRKNTLSGFIVITNDVTRDTNWADVAYFKITAITNGRVFTGTTEIVSGAFVENVVANTGVKFLPATNSIANGSFNVQCARDVNGAGLNLTPSNCTIKIVANIPVVTPTTTNAVRGATND
ncbi:MAG: hypothetical protein Q8O57_09800, partial [Kiritimatiellota bacterium]|nr:hypothetical protein [Kiritimatiellota bacterium]